MSPHGEMQPDDLQPPSAPEAERAEHAESGRAEVTDTRDRVSIPSMEERKVGNFLRVEAGLLYEPRWREQLSLGALQTYLCHLKGYVGSRHYSGMGMKGIRERTGMRPRDVLAAERELTEAGLIFSLSAKDPRLPRTCIASLGEPFSDEADASQDAVFLDGHNYELLSATNTEMALLPWSLVDASPDMSAPTIADVGSKEALILLIWLYLVARDDGYVYKASARAKVAAGESDGTGTLTFEMDMGEMFQIDADITYRGTLQELLDIGLVELGPQGIDGCYPLVLLHRRSVNGGSTEQAA